MSLHEKVNKFGTYVSADIALFESEKDQFFQNIMSSEKYR